MGMAGAGLLVPDQDPEQCEMPKNNLEEAVSGVRMRQFSLIKTALTFVVITWALSGCISLPPWAQVGGPYQGSLYPHPETPDAGPIQQPESGDRVDFQVTLPTGWRRASFVHDALLLTRDGISLQYMRIGAVAVGNELALTKKAFANGMSPPDIAALELDEVRSDWTLRSFALVENTPFQVAGLPGFKLVYTFKTENWLRLKRVHYGVMVRDWVYRVQYQAPVRYYFEKDLATFERVRESFRIREKP